ncbi:MAG: hypothetical protein Q8M78_04925, partial [Burkholderiaceae bacterium]|nr:hypothetical protein [Burkholderiaceae bacterium]
IDKQCRQHKADKHHPEPQGSDGFHKRPAKTLVLKNKHPQGLAALWHSQGESAPVAPLGHTRIDGGCCHQPLMNATVTCYSP